MGKRTEHKPDPKLQKLGSVRIVLCVIALILCGTTVFSALNLRPKTETTVDETTEITTAATTAEATTEATTEATVEADAVTPAEADAETPAGADAVTPAGADAVTPAEADAETPAGADAVTPAEADAETPAEADAVTPTGADAETPAGADAVTPAGAGGQSLPISPDNIINEGSGSTHIKPTEPTGEGEGRKSFVIPPASTQPTETTALPAEATTAPEGSEEPETTKEPEASEEPETPEESETSGWALPVLIASIVLLAADLTGIGICSGAIRRRNEELRQVRRRRITGGGTASGGDDNIRTQSLTARPASDGITVGTLQNIGGRPYQEDSSGVANLSDGVLAVVADGMGGLSNGDKVSQKIVYTMLGFSNTLRQGQMDGVLPQMVKGTADVVNRMLGSDGLYKSGSTLMAVLVRGDRFHWIAVGDSHIYLFRDGQLIQLNQEHNRGQDLLRRAIAGELTFDEVRADPKKSGLTSFIGMGELKYVEKSLQSIPLQAGDRIVLMTDGVFNALSDAEIATVLARNPDVKTAAKMMEQGVLAKAAPHQDNFTAVILGL